MTRLRFLAAMAALAVACTTEDSVTPKCATPEECHPDPICEVAPSEPAQCCVDAGGAPLTGVDLEVCLIGFGVDPVGTGGGGSGGNGAAGGGGSGATGGSGGSGGTGGAVASGGSGGTGGTGGG
jgi:hypothetical protein